MIAVQQTKLSIAKLHQDFEKIVESQVEKKVAEALKKAGSLDMKELINDNVLPVALNQDGDPLPVQTNF